MPTGLREGITRNEQSGSLNEPLPEGFTEPWICPSGIPRRGETLIQGLLDETQCSNHQQRSEVSSLLFHDICLDSAYMNMSVNEAGE